MVVRLELGLLCGGRDGDGDGVGGVVVWLVLIECRFMLRAARLCFASTREF